MDDYTPATTRLTRGIHLHGRKFDEKPSFSLGLTQEFGEVAGSKYKNDPFRSKGISGKAKQIGVMIVEGGIKHQGDASSAKKRKGKEIELPMNRQKNTKSTHTPHMQCYTNVEVMNVLVGKLFETQYRRFLEPSFFREIVDSSEDAIMIHVNGTTLRFIIRDFAIISWLKCSDNESNFVFNTEEPNRIILQYFDAGKPITKKQLVDNFNNKVWGDNDDDGKPTTTIIDRKDFDLVESDRYMDYPWGKKAFDLLIQHLHTKVKHDGKYYRLYDFPLALQVWFYECCSDFDNEIDVKTKKDFRRLDYFAKGMFRDDNNPNISATPMENLILDLPDPPCPINNKGKEKVESGLSAPMKKLRHTVIHTDQMKTQPILRKSPRLVTVPKKVKLPPLKSQAKQRANAAAYQGIKLEKPSYCHFW
ncbi:hypothetical protein H5410_006804 [Solanum commersonii]|uniref:DUF1985 domain-containing protein n=1 Tax=Solanum commersonii TaxID=4109 RepID=A0A9J6ABK7_SOLCO|nr:hypothetical protein H5410_006804 [Solanum commersonii]